MGLVIPDMPAEAWAVFAAVGAACVLVFVVAAIPSRYHRRGGHKRKGR